MPLPPVIEREMRAAVRSAGALKARWWVAVAATAGAAFFLLLSMAAGARVWVWFHKYLFAAAVYLAVVRPAQHAAGLFAEERRNQTLELIYLTGISSFELFVTKFFGGLVLASSELLALVPFIALPFLSGGVSLDLFLATAAALPTLLVFTLSLTIMVSVLCTDESHALAWIGGIIAAMSLILPLAHSLGMIVAGTPPFDERWLCFSPAYAPYLVFTNFGTAGAKGFWLASAVTWLWAILFFVAAGWLLHRTWREDPDAGFWNALRMRFAAQHRSRNVKRLGEIVPFNPFQWRVEHNRRSITAAWSASAGIVALWLVAWAVWRSHWPSPANLYATAFLLVMLVDLFQLQAPAQDIASHRRDGIFELLLTSPLQPSEIVDGQIRGLAAQFRPLRNTLCALFIGMMLGGVATRPWTGQALITYFLIWGVLLMWAGTNRRRSLPTIMWIALNSGRGTWAVMRSHAGAGWPWIINFYNFRNAFRAFGTGSLTFPSGSVTELWVVSVAAAFAVIVMIVAAYEKNPLYRRLVDEMRSIVQEPVPSPKDPRFRRWNVKERLPSDQKLV